MLRRLLNLRDEAFHIGFFLLAYLHAHYVAGHGEGDEQRTAVHVGYRLAFGGNGFHEDVLQQNVGFLSHYFCAWQAVMAIIL